MESIPQDERLLTHLLALLKQFRPAFKQQRVYNRAVVLLVGEVLTLARHTVTQILVTLGWVERDWSAWYRLFRRERFPYPRLAFLFLKAVLEDFTGKVFVVAGDGTTTPRTSRKMEGVGWLPHPGTAPFQRGLSLRQRWFHLAWLTPAEGGYTRAIPLLWLPAFTIKARRQAHPARSEVWAARLALRWLRAALCTLGRGALPILFVGDGRYDQVNLWRHLPRGVILMARSAKNRRLFFLPEADMRPNRKYGHPAPTPQEVWRERKGWRKTTVKVRGRTRHLQVKVVGPVLRRGAPEQPLFLIVVRGKSRGKVRREPLPFLVNAVRQEGQWVLPLPVEDLLFWAWQRWEIEVVHRELKSTFGLGEKQCWHVESAVRSVQWSAWAYAVLVLAGYRAWGIQGGERPPTRWWRGGERWSLNTLWRAYRAAWWGAHHFRAVDLERWLTEGDLSWIRPSVRQAALGAARI